jgi:hypothetical protein
MSHSSVEVCPNRNRSIETSRSPGGGNIAVQDDISPEARAASIARIINGDPVVMNFIKTLQTKSPEERLSFLTEFARGYPGYRRLESSVMSNRDFKSCYPFTTVGAEAVFTNFLANYSHLLLPSKAEVQSLESQRIKPWNPAR